jgi:hypothetical protein
VRRIAVAASPDNRYVKWQRRHDAQDIRSRSAIPLPYYCHALSGVKETSNVLWVLYNFRFVETPTGTSQDPRRRILIPRGPNRTQVALEDLQLQRRRHS